MPHVSFGTVQESLELQAVRVPIRDDVADLADDGREYEDSDQVADYCEDVPANQEGRKRADQSEGDVISVLRSWTSGPRRSLSPLSLSYFLSSFLLAFLAFVRPSFDPSPRTTPRTHAHTPRVHAQHAYTHTRIHAYTHTRTHILSSLLHLLPSFASQTHTHTHTRARARSCKHTCGSFRQSVLVGCSPFDPDL